MHFEMLSPIYWKSDESIDDYSGNRQNVGFIISRCSFLFAARHFVGWNWDDGLKENFGGQVESLMLGGGGLTGIK